MKRALFLCLLLGLSPCALMTQGTGASARIPDSGGAAVPVMLGQSVVALTGPWKFHIGDNPQWADPNFDDSAWDTMDLNPTPGSVVPYLGGSGFVPGWTARGYAGYSGYAWYRLRLHVQESLPDQTPAANARLALKMPESVDDAYQVYVNGQYIGEFGRFQPHGVTMFLTKAQLFRLPAGIAAETGGTLLIAVRMWMDPSTPLTYPDAGGMHESPVFGLAPAVHTLLRLDQEDLVRALASAYLEGAILLVALLVVLTLYRLDRSEPAYLWLALIGMATLFNDSITNVLAYINTWIGGTRIIFIQDAVLAPVIIGMWVLFWAHWFRLRNIARLHRLVWPPVLLLALGMAMLRAPLYGRLVPVHAEVWLLPFTVTCKLLLGALIVWVTYQGIRRDPAEGWMALPAVVLAAISLYQEELLVMHAPVSFFRLGYVLNLGQIASLLSLVIITILMFRRFLHTQRQREQWKVEMEQARQVQSLLVPAAATETPGFAVESVYLPASSVGGDFFQVRPGDDGSLLIVVGDVSGKGLKAAMMVSAIVGALSNEPSHHPPQVLENLNCMLHGKVNGFVTCCAALIDPDGAMTIANAGHLSPYRNGQEVTLHSGLPLGIMAGSTYQEMQYALHPGDRLTFVSDGVIEATNDKRELFGFERTAALSNQPARTIAQAAQQFGQEDDITVLSVMLTPKLQEATA
jgi:hypothetical protein